MAQTLTHAFGGRYLGLEPGELIRYTDRFEDPNLPGEMTTTVPPKPVSVGTEVVIVQESVPAAIPPEACYLGWQQSLNHLTILVEPEIKIEGCSKSSRIMNIDRVPAAGRPEAPRQEEEEIRGLYRSLVAAWDAGDAEACAKHFAENCCSSAAHVGAAPADGRVRALAPAPEGPLLDGGRCCRNRADPAMSDEAALSEDFAFASGNA